MYESDESDLVVEFAQTLGYAADDAFPNDLTNCEQCGTKCREWDIEHEEDGILVTLNLCISCIASATRSISLIHRIHS